MPHIPAADTPDHDRPAQRLSCWSRRIARPQPGDVTPYDAYVALPGRVLRGPEEPMPGRSTLVGHLLHLSPDHPVVTFHVRDNAIAYAHAGPIAPRLQSALAEAWWTGRMKSPRTLHAALAEEMPELAECARLLVIVRVPVPFGRSLGLGFAADTRHGGDVLWDLSTYDADRKEAFLLRRYDGQEARERATLVRQAALRDRDAELPVPTTRLQAEILALEWALKRHVMRKQLPPGFLDTLQGDLRSIVEANLDALWDSDADEPRLAAPQDLSRWLPHCQ